MTDTTGGGTQIRNMKSKMKSLILSSAILLLTTASVTAQEFSKRAQTTMKFLSVSLDAKANALAEAVTSVEGGAESMFYNPAAMSRFDGMVSTSFSHVQWIADINYSMAALAYRPANGLYGVFGVNVMAVDYGDIPETILAENDRGYLEVGTFSPNAFSAGISYAKAISTQFSVGGNVKYVFMDLATGATGVEDAGSGIDGSNITRSNFSENTIAYDFGVHYITGYKSLNFAFVVRNYSQEVAFDTENAELPLTMKIGFSFDLVDAMRVDKELHSLQLSVDANRPRDFDEQILTGLEYTFMNSFSLRGGYRYPTDEHSFNFGAGLKQKFMGVGFKIDYSYTDFGVFNNVNTFSLKLSF